MAAGELLQRSDPERLVMVAFHEPEAGGATRSVLRVVPLLEGRGWRFCFWAPGPGGLQEELRARGYDVAGLPRELRYSLGALRHPPGPARRLASVPGYLRAFREWVRSQRPALVHANTRLTIPEAFISRRAGSATVLHVHEMLLPGPRSTTAARLVKRSADAVVAVSEATAAKLRGQGLEALVVPNGVTLPNPIAHNGQEGALVVGTLATVSRRKGTDVFVDAARELGTADGELEFRIVGPLATGPEEQWAEQLVADARRAGVEHRVVDDPVAELAEWDIFVLPSREDPFPLAVLEGMAAGLPVIASRVDGIAEQLTDDTGILVTAGEPGELITALRGLASSPERRAALGVAARARVEERFTLEAQAAGLETAYRVALARRGSAGPA